MPLKEKENNYYKYFADFLIKYEEVNLKLANQHEIDEMALVSDTNKINFKERLDILSSEAKNPFSHIKNWIKGEIFEMQGVLEAVA